ncbi:hypothetical protein PAPYR_1753 [Paratrimastix pyriformis]|uniref:Uncharacterized protein n=1 Tax=Paratrimastix pyriformis TaxID=342808 RepID=A0ABQ8UY26_9EUKA|nr:hypothetical protein PAPYR_1753 [Paratrimastix pyriformis]
MEQRTPTPSSMEDHIIVGIHVSDRHEDTKELNQLLTDTGRCIRTRLGLHDPSHDQTGIIVLELVGPREERERSLATIQRANGCEVKVMRFVHPTGRLEGDATPHHPPR